MSLVSGSITGVTVPILELKKWGYCGAKEKSRGANINVSRAW